MKTMLAVTALLMLNGTAVCAVEQEPAVLILLAPGFQWHEYWIPYGMLRAVGYRMDVAGPVAGPTDDAIANITLDQVDVGRYRGLYIPGGSSPMKLETNAVARTICRDFMQNDKPVAAVCHGPRLLMTCDLLKDRVVTMLHEVAGELPDAWREKRFGPYLDREIVIDRNLVTGRHPPDMEWLCPAFLERLHAAGGIAPQRLRCNLLVLAENPKKTDVIMLEKSLLYLGIDARVWNVADPRTLTNSASQIAFDMGLVWGDSKASVEEPKFRDQLLALHKNGKPILTGAGSETLLKSLGVSNAEPLAGKDIAEALNGIVHAVQVKGLLAGKSVPPSQSDCTVVIGASFDERAYLGVAGQLRVLGKSFLTVAPRVGWQRGRSGYPVEATALVAASTTVTDLGQGIGVVGIVSDGEMKILRGAAEGAIETPKEVGSYDTAIVVRDGFFEDTFFAAKAWCAVSGRKFAVVAADSGTVHSVNGIAVEAKAASEIDASLRDGSLAMVTDALWPLVGQEKEKLGRTTEWVVQRYQKHNDTLIAFGLAAKDYPKRLGNAVPKGSLVVFSYNHNNRFWKTGDGKHEPYLPLATQTAERFITVHAADGLGVAVRLLTQQHQVTKGEVTR